MEHDAAKCPRLAPMGWNWLWQHSHGTYIELLLLRFCASSKYSMNCSLEPFRLHAEDMTRCLSQGLTQAFSHFARMRHLWIPHA
eukprot:5907744-Amphidinium_carterae.2